MKGHNVKNKIWIILLIVSFSFGCVNAENEQEIGVPVRPSISLQPYYMVLAPTGERAYVMYHGKLVQYQLNPLKILSSVDIDLDVPPLENKNYPKSVHHHRHTSKRLFITKDEKRMIIYGYTDMKLFDMAMNKVIKTIPLNKGAAVLNDNEFVTFEKENTVVTIWNANDLTKLRQFRSGGTHWRTDGIRTFGTYTAHKVGGYIFAISGPVFRILDSKTYKEIFAFQLNNTILKASPWIDYDLKMLVVRYASIVPPYTSIATGMGEWKFHLEDKRLERIRDSYSLHGVHLENIRLYTKSAIQVSPTNQYSSAEGSLMYKDKYRIKSLFQFPDGEAVLWSIKTNKFQITKNARKHLTMKNANDEVVPLNNATFKKYNQAGISHLEW